MTDRIESMQIDVDEIRRNRAAIAELVGALNGFLALDSTFPSSPIEFIEALARETGGQVAKAVLSARAAVTKYSHIVDANKMVPITEEKE